LYYLVSPHSYEEKTTNASVLEMQKLRGIVKCLSKTTLSMFVEGHSCALRWDKWPWPLHVYTAGNTSRVAAYE
jgi:hypothetical protein